ncbi:MAG TPA: DJ-1/PfpI/YhbO family deglycase/protease [Micavibrio sp.]|nr:DJ-1/PfpI/YhbO family deglycase/protease [Micavibrio sp.]
MDKEIPRDIHAARPQRFPQQGRVAIITADNVEDQEFFYPYYRFLEAGYVVDVLTPKGKDLKGKNGAGLEDTVKIEDANADEYDLLYVPGGKAPAKLKKEKEAVEFVQQFCKTGRPVGAICHGPQLLAKAGVISGRKIAAWPECEEEVEEAGAVYQYTECMKDGPFITGRWPGDLPGQMKAVMEALGAKQFPQKRVA